MKKEFDLQKFKREYGIKDPVVGSRSCYEIYLRYFPELDYKTFVILDKNGMRGRLFRGQGIDLPWGNLFIPYCWWRNEIFKMTNQHVPCVVKSENPYWNEDC